MYHLKDIILYGIFFIILPIFLINNAIVLQERLSLPLAQGQQGQDNASATDMLNLRNKIIPQAEEVNEANSELIKICTDSPNASCDNTMKIISLLNPLEVRHRTLHIGLKYAPPPSYGSDIFTISLEEFESKFQNEMKNLEISVILQ